MPVLFAPPENNSFYNPSSKNDLDPALIFVFGSNIAGIHGLGAAQQAVTYFGAKFGKGVGRHGMSYAIPTKDHNLNILPLEEIKKYVDEFVAYTQTSGEKFYVTPVGTGLAKYPHSEIAPMFKGAKNCWFPATWVNWLI